MSEKSIHIENQNVNNGATINNIANQENNLCDDLLEWHFKKLFKENNELHRIFDVIKYISNKDKIKDRFGGSYYRYEEMANSCLELIDNNSDIELVSTKHLDDGYKSVISSILNVSNLFCIKEEGSELILISKDYNKIIASIKSLALKISFKDIKSRREYNEAKENAENIKKIVLPYLQCSKAYGEFFQFNDIYIENQPNLPFIDKTVKFVASDEIIPKLIHPLYGDKPECGLRELIQNSCDACKEMQINNQCIIDPCVEIYLNKIDKESNWVLKIRDYGVGMDEEILINKYFVIGESSKRQKDGNLLGQFGIGALATFLLGDKIELKTKRYNEKKVLSFEYYYKLNEDNRSENNEIDIKISKDENFLNGTEITILLKNEFNNYNIEKLERKLKLHEWYLMSDIKLKYFVNYNEKEITTLKNDTYLWNKFIENDNFYVEYLTPNSKPKNNNIKNGKSIYNGILIEENYALDEEYITYKPFVNIVDRKKIIKLDLSRSRILNPEIFSYDLKKIIYNKTIENLINDSKSKKLVEDNVIKSFEYKNEYMKNIPLFFCKEGFGTYSTKSIERIKRDGKYKKIVKVFRFFGGIRKIKLTDLADGCIYVFDNYELQKTYISYLILAKGKTIIPAEILKRFFYNATNSNNGFKKETIKHIYKCLNKSIEVSDTARAVWDYHNDKKEELFSDKLMEPDMISLCDEKEYDINIVDKEELYKDCIIKISNISDINIWDENDAIIKIDDFGVEFI